MTWTVTRGAFDAVVREISIVNVFLFNHKTPVFQNEQEAQIYCDRFNQLQQKSGTALSLLTPLDQLMELYSAA
ncbi:hypothetical protein H6G00_05100 [Leptolyngbya sp. FACHB-541]|uniref:hypothetical protein n=1 Tax=Leptolyngbya sp. FACHB-541 TaxID=2692810 RepID=UPI001688EF79|nr:hypothetical protein [Leptolyngbya sp. FACHB-541]MBD1995993.1 hypothetical protein [Leptolyngbya sp. FACHB-541]